MTRNRFNQAKDQSTSTSTNMLTLSKARGLFLEDNDNTNMKDTYKITNVHPPTDVKDVVNKEYCDNNLLSSNNKIDILSKNITELRKSEFEEVTTGQLNASIIRLPSSTTNGGAVWIDDQTVELVSIISNNLTILAYKLTESENNIVRFSNKVAADTISKYNQLKQKFDNNKFNQNNTNIPLDDMFTNGLREMKEHNKSLRKVIVQYIVALLLRSKLIENKEQDRLEMHYDLNQEDIMKEIEIFFLMKMSNPTAPSERLLYPRSGFTDPDLTSVSERLINEKIQANN